MFIIKKNFNILKSSLTVLHNFDGLAKLFLGLAKFLDTLTKTFFLFFIGII